MSSKRTRAANFNANEVRLLIDIAIKFSTIIENKETDAVTWKQKNEAWDKIANQFNSQSGGAYRDMKTLRLKYDCIKREIKAKVANNKMELYKTGGGPIDVKPLQDFEEKLLPIISVSVEGLAYRNDCDEQTVIQLPRTDVLSASMLPSTSKETGTSELEMEVMADLMLDVTNVIPETENKENEKKYSSNWATPNSIRKRKLTTKSKDPKLDAKYNIIASDREKLVKLQLENAMKEKEYILKKTSYLEELHALKIKKIKLDIRERELNLLHKYPNLDN